MKLLAGNSNRPLAEAIAQSLDVPLTRAQVKRFPDNEAWVTIDENVRGEDVFVIQSTSYPANDNLMDLHSGQIQGFFDIPTDNLQAAPLMATDVQMHYRDAQDVLIVSPDVGGVVRALALASRLNAGL